MYTDTKNLAHQFADLSFTTGNTTLPPPTAPVDKSKRKLCKMWRPLMRLMARKRSNNTIAGSNSNTASLHPNNVHLNNTIPSKPCATTNSGAGEEWPTTLIEDYTSLMRKMSCKEECNHGAWEATANGTVPESERPCQASAKFATTVISSASIEKTPPSTCAHCVYGRNCQHEQFHHHICDAATQATTAAATVGVPHLPHTATDAITTLSQHVLADLPIQFVHTDDGTFFWTNTQEKIDDDLLTAWLCQSWSQLPVEAAVL
ncbi:enhancer of split M2 protein [Anastrepha obliqua]|uniref:enhancer of split M2 protein n=1 Tax=Anastrepha obliqua TaxID=95512 RepID=UPI0024090B12|nr:enhancer of split M2 protein [Anastrepha obliqua]